MILDAIFTEDNHILDADFGLVVPIGNREEIYNAGKLATLKESQYMNGKESGTIISVNDVTPIEHNVGVKLSSDTITDFTGVEVRKCGANLFPFSEGITLKGRYLNAWSDDFLPRQNNVEFLRGKRITFSAYYDLSGAVEDTTTASVKIMQYDDNGTILSQMFGNTIKKADGTTQGYSHVVSDVLENTTRLAFALSIFFNGTQTPNANSFVTVSQGMVTLGTGLKEYEPYTETIYTANADGTVEGVKSISPNMTLIPNNNAVTIECEYLRDIDLYIDNLITNVALTGGN